MTSKYKHEQPVHIKVGNQQLRWCSITAIKFPANGSIRYDLVLDGVTFYDVSEDLLIDANKESFDDKANSGYLT